MSFVTSILNNIFEVFHMSINGEYEGNKKIK